MTAKQAVKARCRDCLAGARECGFTDCALKGLAKAKGRVKVRVIKAYCRWCLNGHPFSVCSSPNCAINQFRKEHGYVENTPNLELKAGIEGGLSLPNSKDVKSHGKGLEAPEKRYTA